MSAQDRYFSQKIRTLFTRFDMDKNGAIEIDDFHVWSDRLTKIGKLNSEKERNLRENLLYLWEVFFEPADINADGSVEIPELVIHMKNTLSNPKKRQTIETIILLIFEAIDTNGDGSIEANELFDYYSSFGVKDRKFSDEIFNTIDSNHDGSLSQEEFYDFGVEFFFGTNPSSTSRFFFGPLVV